MFNVVGYMNYRYFFLFLGYVLLACVYGLCLTAVPFIEQVCLIAPSELFCLPISMIEIARYMWLELWECSSCGPYPL